MFNLGDEGVHFQRRHCSTSAARGVQLGRYIQLIRVKADAPTVNDEVATIEAIAIAKKFLTLFIKTSS